GYRKTLRHRNPNKSPFFPYFTGRKSSHGRTGRSWLWKENEVFPRFVGAPTRVPLRQETRADGQRHSAQLINTCKLTAASPKMNPDRTGKFHQHPTTLREPNGW